MSAGKKQSDEELLFDVELLTIQQVATWGKVSTGAIASRGCWQSDGTINGFNPLHTAPRSVAERV